MKTAIYTHVPWETPGLIRSAIENSGGTFEVLSPADLARFSPAYEESGAVVIMGGPMSANDDLDFLRAEEEIIRRAAADGKPLLGVCLGAQLMAKALGGRVYVNPVKEIGWGEVELTPEAASDFLFTGVENLFSVFQWHGETFDLPPGAVHLASSPVCRNQAFRFGRNAWALQFHIEITEDMLNRWLSEPAMCGDLRHASAPIIAEDAKRTLSPSARLILDRWASLPGR